jgi:predicted phosphoribosyltransferase
MPVTYKIDKQQRLISSNAYGVVTREEILEHQRKLAADPDFSPTFSQIADFTRTTKLEIKAADVQVFAARNIFAPTVRRAIVVTDGEAFGLARMFEILRDAKGEQGNRVFIKLEDALKWISSGQE